MEQEQQRLQREQEQDKANNAMAVQLMNQYHPKIDWHQALDLVKRHNRNLAGIEAEIRQKFGLRLLLINPGNTNMRLNYDGSQTDEGLKLIESIIKTFPPPAGMSINIYRDQQCKQVITYTQLSDVL